MNQRIQELARQADAYAWQQIDEGADYDKQPQFFAEKFAELIVRECAHLVGGYVKEDEFGTDVKEAYEEITTHFGVEQ